MPRLPAITLSCGLIVAGVLACALAAPRLLTHPDLDVPLNPLGICRSPYGEVFAMAMQDPIDTYFDVGFAPCSEESDHECHSSHHHPPAGGAATPSTHGHPTVIARLESLVSSLNEATQQRTNPKPASEGLKRHLRRQAEDKLRFAYQLDPAHYGNYNSLHFFLTEPAVGTRPELTPSAAMLAQETIQYCLKQELDPRPALTAAGAATNILHLMFDDARHATPRFSTAQMRECLKLLDHCLARYHGIAKNWEQTHQWEQLSPQRIAECLERLHFIAKIRNAAEQTIIRLENQSHTSAAQRLTAFHC